MALGSRYGWLAGAMALSASACGFDVTGGTSVDASMELPPPDQMVPPPTRASCKALHDAEPSKPSGTYDIDPDGSGPEAPISVTCDMTTVGGGWTLIFTAETPNLANQVLSYDTDSPALLTAATETLIAYRDSSMAALPNAATFALPEMWRTRTPFSYASEDQIAMVSIDGATAVQTLLRFGNTTFANNCNDAWNSTVFYGRLCIQGSTAPFFTGFAVSDPDTCSDSGSTWNASACSTTRRFTIAVR